MANREIVINPIIEPQFLMEITTAILSVPIVFVPHYHYSYLDNALVQLISTSQKTHCGLNISYDDLVEFDIARGSIDFNTKKKDECYKLPSFLTDLLDNENGLGNKKIYLFKGALKSLFSDEECILQLLQFATLYEKGVLERTKTLIFIDDIPISSFPSVLIPHTQVVNILLPSAEIIEELLLPIPLSKSIFLTDEREAYLTSLIRTFQGLHQLQIINILRSVLVRTGGYLSKVALNMAETEKKNLVKKTDTLEIIETDITLKQIGGLEVLQKDILQKAKFFKNLSLATSHSVKLQMPKGILILGMPGCGKSMIAKAIADEFATPLLRLDVNKLMGKYVGESEENLRKALQTAESTHPCILWIDEVEKAFAGTQNSSGNDSLIIRLMGCFLTWMQERKTPIYVVATANDTMRPEFMRKGRFDEVYFVNFPTESECVDILLKKLSRYNSPDSIFDFQTLTKGEYQKIALAMQGGVYGGFAGSEIEAVVSMVMENAFIKYLGMSSQHRVPIKVDDFLSVIASMKDAVMANQKGKLGQKTNVERILEIQECYHFKSASNKKD